MNRRSLNGLSVLFLFAVAVAFWAHNPASLISGGAAAADAPAVIQFKETLAGALAEEKAAVVLLKENIAQERERAAEVTATADAIRIENATIQNLLVAADAPITSLDDAWSRMKAMVGKLDTELNALGKQAAFLQQRREQIASQTAVYQRQLADLQLTSAGGDKDILAETKRLMSVLTTKNELVDTYEKLIAGQIASLSVVRGDVAAQARQFETHIRQLKQENLFVRRDRLALLPHFSSLAGEIKALLDQLQTLLMPGFWAGEALGLWHVAGYSLFSYMLVAVVWLGLLLHLRRWLSAVANRDGIDAFPAALFCLNLLRHHLFAAGVAAGLFLCLQIDIIYFSVPSIQYLTGLIALWVFTGWFFKGAAAARAQAGADPWHGVIRHLVFLLMLVRGVGSLSIVLRWSLPTGDPLLPSLLRLCFELVFIVWALSLGRCIRLLPVGMETMAGPWRRMTAGLLVAAGVVGLIVDLAGYGQLARHWYLSMGRSAVVLFWAVLVFKVIQQWESARKQRAAATPDTLLSPLSWLVIRAAELGWSLSVVLLLILSWGGGHAFISNLLTILRMPLSAGSLNFSLLSILAAAATLLLTHTVVRIWRHVLRLRLLSQSGMESGLQESITTISAYVLWGFGILLALTVFGLDSASLAVAFGAIGIGLGFGLQNIFSNFVSGLILLFERPIQVGDDVEIDGVWAIVKKINVRATVVQTYDNASLIIPNAEFISKQVTNWSFKDRTVRRRIDVGVAYGSDIEMVRDTLLEIAAKTAHVQKRPKPDVLFLDFGDSALVFRLRIWTDLDNMLRVETAVRFAIDRLFRERGIEIAFPQRDIHIRTPAPPPFGPPPPLPEAPPGDA